MQCVAVILAIDPGVEFTGSKYLERIGDVTMIDTIVAEATEWPVEEVVVVLGPDADEVIDGADLSGTTIVIDPQWEEGIASSLRVTVDLLLRGQATDRLVLACGDQPGITAGTVSALLERFPGPNAVVPKYRYRRGWPIVLSSDLWDMLLGLEGPADLHDVLESHPEGVEEVWFDRLEPQHILAPSDLPPRRPRG